MRIIKEKRKFTFVFKAVITVSALIMYNACVLEVGNPEEEQPVKGGSSYAVNFSISGNCGAIPCTENKLIAYTDSGDSITINEAELKIDRVTFSDGSETLNLSEKYNLLSESGLFNATTESIRNVDSITFVTERSSIETADSDETESDSTGHKDSETLTENNIYLNTVFTGNLGGYRVTDFALKIKSTETTSFTARLEPVTEKSTNEYTISLDIAEWFRTETGTSFADVKVTPADLKRNSLVIDTGNNRGFIENLNKRVQQSTEVKKNSKPVLNKSNNGRHSTTDKQKAGTVNEKADSNTDHIVTGNSRVTSARRAE